jgi:hypothetical protein
MDEIYERNKDIGSFTKRTNEACTIDIGARPRSLSES